MIAVALNLDTTNKSPFGDLISDGLYLKGNIPEL